MRLFRLCAWFLPALLAVSAHAQDARRIVDPLDPDIIDNAVITSVRVETASTAVAAVARFDAAAARKAAKARKAQASPTAQSGRPDPKAYDVLPTAEMFPLVIEDIAKEFNLSGTRRIQLVVTLETLKQPNGFMTLVASSNEEVAGMVEVYDADKPDRSLGIFHIDVVNTYALGVDALARGAPREFMAREFSREMVRVLAGRKSRTRADVNLAPATPKPDDKPLGQSGVEPAS